MTRVKYTNPWRSLLPYYVYSYKASCARSSFVIFDIWALRAERQSVRMSKITNHGLTGSGTERIYSCTHVETVGVKRLNNGSWTNSHFSCSMIFKFLFRDGEACQWRKYQYFPIVACQVDTVLGQSPFETEAHSLYYTAASDVVEHGCNFVFTIFGSGKRGIAQSTAPSPQKCVTDAVVMTSCNYSPPTLNWS